MPAGYSGTPLVKKLGIKPDYTIMPVHEPDDDQPADFIHLFARNEKTLHNDFAPLKSVLDKNGMLWVSWIKKSSKLETDISEGDVRSLGLKIGLVDVKICAVDKDWSALKFVYRKEDR